MTCTLKNLKIVCVKFFGKIGRMLVADLAYVIVHHLKPICWTLLRPAVFLAVYVTTRKGSSGIFLFSWDRIFNLMGEYFSNSLKKDPPPPLHQREPCLQICEICEVTFWGFPYMIGDIKYYDLKAFANMMVELWSCLDILASSIVTYFSNLGNSSTTLF